ncbi:MAG TPA: Pnap_2097 family protein [Polyangia bacterium]|nr:Pnap_2097 family protein [Polyangia bacterium]
MSVSFLPLPETAIPVSAATRAEAPSPRRIRIGMPHMDAGGLSENWLLRHCGDLHWEAITRRLGVAIDEIRGEGQQRLYPTVIALRGRYSSPLSTVREDDVLCASVELVPCGSACAHGRVAASVGERRFSIELLTTFAQRQEDGALRMALPAARLASRWTPMGPPPPLAQLAKAARRGEPLPDAFSGPRLQPAGAPLGETTYEPSPYADYNGAGLLYFASYATIADTVERRLVRRLRLAPANITDWATATSPVRRDVFFYRNLPLGETLLVELLAFEREHSGSVKTRVRLRREQDGTAIADVVTRRAFVSERT